ncbi:MAG TPA: Uma2 family endonuclease [Blastocatellia bacterium]|nr:Uma2 family endonuclease [Blastocatellia bacterium]
MTTNLERLMTVADLDAIPEDGNLYELIGGAIFMSRAPSIPHQRILLNLIVKFSLYLAKNPVGELLPGPGVIFDDHNAVIPDLVFVSNEQRGRLEGQDRLTWAPALVIEILSPGPENARRDLEIKAEMYSAFEVGEYWVVDPQSQTVRIHRTKEGSYEAITLSEDDEINSPEILPGFRFKVGSVFEAVSPS